MKKIIGILVLFTVAVAGCKKEKKDVLATVATTTATGITGSAAVTGGSITNTGNTAISQSGVVYATHANPTLTDSLRNNTSGGNTFTINLTTLNANTVYYVRAFAINGTGTTYGNQVTFTTAAGLATVTTTPVGAISASAATAPSGGTIVNTGGAAITASGVCWSTKSHPTVTNSATNDQITNNAFTSTLSLLVSNTTYYYRAYATNSFGTAYGNELSFNSGSTETVQDVDGNVYHTITINGQTWMTENLRVTHYQNGDPIVNIFTASSYDWHNGTNGGGYMFVNGDTTKVTLQTYGLLYSSFVLQDTRNIAPSGWHVATQSDWNKLCVYEGMPAADTVAINLYGQTSGADKNGAIDPLLLTGGASGLNLQLAGYDYYGQLMEFGLRGYFWTSTGPGTGFFIEDEVYGPTQASYPGINIYEGQGLGQSIRCVKNN